MATSRRNSFGSAKDPLRTLGWRLAPGLMAERALAWNRSVRIRAGIADEAERFLALHGPVVQAGPFAGLRYAPGRAAEIDSLVEKLAGSYERELHPVVAEALARRARIFLDIGTADGYYAVGFAKAAGVDAYGFESARSARALCAELAELNGVRLDLRGRATSARLRTLPLEHAFVLSDCEGAEMSIFDRDAVRALRTALVVIELHEWARPGVEATLRERFDASHRIEVITGVSPAPLRIDKGRGMVCRPRASAG